VRDLSAWTRRVPIWLIVAILMAGVGLVTVAQAQPGAQAPGQEPKGDDVPEMTMLELLLKGGYFMVPIGLCSLMGLAIIIERLVATRRGAVIPPGFLPGLKATFRHDGKDRPAGLAYCTANDSPISRMVAAGIRRMRRGEEAVEKGIEDAGAIEVGRLRRNLRVLYGVAAVAPMLGLLGTVWGMIKAFQATSKIGLTGAERATSLAEGIYEALVTTFAGLIVAIPVLIVYYYFLSRIDGNLHEMNEVSGDFIEHYLGDEATEAAAQSPAETPAS